MRGCVIVCFSSFSLLYDRLNTYAKQVKVNEFLKEEEIKSLFDNEDYILFDFSNKIIFKFL